jgi:hypothetical protein
VAAWIVALLILALLPDQRSEQGWCGVAKGMDKTSAVLKALKPQFIGDQIKAAFVFAWAAVHKRAQS